MGRDDRKRCRSARSELAATKQAPRRGLRTHGDARLRSLTCGLALGPLVWLVATNGASAQIGPGAYDAMVEGICRQSATAQTGMPADLMFDQCMIQRHCRVSSGSSEPSLHPACRSSARKQIPARHGPRVQVRNLPLDGLSRKTPEYPVSGSDGSNPVPCSAESVANLISGATVAVRYPG